MKAGLKRLLFSLLGALLLAAAFIAYLSPDFVVDLANRFILC